MALAEVQAAVPKLLCSPDHPHTLTFRCPECTKLAVVTCCEVRASNSLLLCCGCGAVVRIR